MKKRICALSFLCVFILSLFTVTQTFAAAESDIQLLTDLGIVKAASHTGLIPKAYTRGDFAASLAYMDAAEAADWQSVTEDITLYAQDIAGNENANSIVEVLAQGYMETDGRGYFRPNEGLLVQEAVSALIRILGYEPLVQKNGGTVADAYQMASKIGLLRGVIAPDGERLTWEQAARLLANAMSVRIYSPQPIVLEDACFYDYWDLTKHTGKILANGNLGLLVEKTPLRHVNIDGTLYQTDLMIEDEAVGSEVVFYTRGETHPQKVVSVYIKNASDTVTLTAKDIEEVTKQGKTIEIQYRNQQKLRVDTMGFVLVNGATQTPTAALFQTFQSGTATFVDSNGDGVFDVVHMTLLMQSVIDGFSSEYETVALRYDDMQIDLKKTDTYAIYLNKKAASLSELEAGMPVGVACDALQIGADGNVTCDFAKARRIVLYASSRTAGGVVQTIDADNIGVDDMDFQFGAGYKRLLADGAISAPKPGEGVALYLDLYGQVTYYKTSASISTMHYGYLIAAARETGGLASGVQVKLMDVGGRIHTYFTSDTFILDGAKVKANALQFDVEGQTVDLTKRQLIRYRLSGDTLREVDTAVVRTTAEDKEGTLTQDLAFDPYKSGGSQYRIRSGAIERRFAFSADCVVFVDDADMDTSNPDEFDFSVTKADALPQEAYLAGYDANDTNEIGCIVYYPSYGKSKDDAAGSLYYYAPNGYVVEKVTESVDAEGKEGFRLYLAGDNKKGEYFAARGTIKLYTAIQDNETGWQREYIQIQRENADNLMSIVKSGDVIRFTTNTGGNITYIEKLFDFASHKNELVAVPNAGGQTYGFVVVDKISGDNIVYHTDDGNKYIFRRRAVYSTVPVYHVQRGKVTLENPADLPTSATGNTVKAFLRYYDYGTVYDHIFYVYD